MNLNMIYRVWQVDRFMPCLNKVLVMSLSIRDWEKTCQKVFQNIKEDKSKEE